MEFLFWFGFGLIVYSYVLYPMAVAIAALGSRHFWKRSDDCLPSVTLIISAYNEERVIEEKLRNSLALEYPKELLEVIVASESTDATNNIVKRYANRGVRLCAFPGRRGKRATLYRVLPTVRGEITLFSDANALYRPDVISRIVRNFADPAVGCVIGRMRYVDPSKTIGGQGEGLYWNYDLWFRRHANRIPGMVPGINGAIFAIRTSLYMPYSEDRGDDYELCTRIVIHGHRAVFEPDAVAEEKASETTVQQFKRKSRLVRWNTVSSLLLLREAIQLRRWTVALQIMSHRLLRYVMPVWLILSLFGAAVLARNSTFYTAAFFAQVTFYLVALVGLAADMLGVRLPKICLIPSYFLMVNSAAVAGLAAGVTKGQATTWQKVR